MNTPGIDENKLTLLATGKAALDGISPMQVVAAQMQLHEKLSQDILVQDTACYDSRYDIRLTYADKNDRVYNVKFPEDTKDILEMDREDYGYRHLSEPFRKTILHGLALYNNQIGDRLREAMIRPEIKKARKKRDREKLVIIKHKNEFNFYAARSFSINLCENMSTNIMQAMSDGCIDDIDRFLAYLYIKSKLTDNDCIDYHAGWKQITDDIESKLILRADMLERI